MRLASIPSRHPEIWIVGGWAGTKGAYRSLILRLQASGARVNFFSSLRLSEPRGFRPADYAGLPAALARQAHHLRNQIGDNKKVNIIAHSMGGMVAAILAAKHPEVIAGIVLMSSAGAQISGAELKGAFIRGLAEDIRKILRPSHKGVRSAIWHGYIGSVGYLVNLVRSYREVQALSSIKYEQFEGLLRAASTKLHVSFLYGKKDPLMCKKAIARMVASLKESLTVQPLDDLGHDLHSHAEKVAEVISKCLRLTPERS